MCFPHVSKITNIHNWVSNVIIKNALILNFRQNIFNLRDTDFVTCIILVLLKRVDDLIKRVNDLIHHLNIR
jgi:hypothetical protein